MLIHLKSFGVLENYLDRSGLEIELPDGSTLADLYASLDSHWQTPPPADVWDPVRRRFTIDHLIIAGGIPLQDEDDPLPAGCQILLIPPLEGG